MICRRLVAFAAALFLLGAPGARATDGNGMEIAGLIPRLLTATSDRNACCVECTMGNVVADAARKYLGSDIAIVCGGDLVANLPSGEITWDELRSAFAEDRFLATATVTVGQLREILEAGLSHIRLNAAERIDVQASMYAGFPQISGFTLYYDASAPPGRRVHDIIMGETSLMSEDDTTTVTLAATSFMLEGGYGLPKVDSMVSTGLTFADVMVRYMTDGMADYQNTGERIHAMGTADISLSGGVIACVIIIAITLSWFRRRPKLRRFSNIER